MLSSILSVLYTSPTQAPEDNGLIGGFIDSGKVEVPENAGFAGGWLKNELADALSWLGDTFLDYVGPFINWGSRIIIVSCFIIYYCSGERKYIAAALKWGVIFLLYLVIRGAVG